MSKDDVIEVEGTVLEKLPNAMFQVELENVMTALFPSISAENFYSYYLPFSVLPFNLLRCLIAAVITLLCYKRISWLLNKF